MVSVIWLILLLIKIAPKASDIDIMGNEVERSGRMPRLKFEYKYCLLASVDQSRKHSLNAIRNAMNLWDGNFVNNALKLQGQELKFTLNQKSCERRKSKPKELSLYGYAIKPECIDLIITFIKPGDPYYPFKNKHSSIVRFDGTKHPKEIVLNEKQKFTIKRITNVIGHELGHFLGLDDSLNDESIMCTTCSNTRVEDVDLRNLVHIFRKKQSQEGGEYQTDNAVERSSKIEELQFQLQNLQLMALPDFIYSTQHTVTFIFGEMLWSYNWNRVPLRGTPQKRVISNTFPLDLANMIQGSSTYQEKAESVFELVLHEETFLFVIHGDKIKMFDGAKVMDLEFSDLLGAHGDRVKTVLLLPPKDIALFTNNFYYLLDMEKWYSQPNARKTLHLRRKSYTNHNQVMRRVKLVYYVYPGDFTIFQAYTDHSYLGTFRVTNKHWLANLKVESLSNMEVVKLPDLLA